jgi:hypothetical protein
MTTDPFDPLLEELDAWTSAGKSAALWWRDDDAHAPCPALDRLAGLSADRAVPCGLAAIPARTDTPLAGFVLDTPHLAVLQHGYTHDNHAPIGYGAWELGAHRPAADVVAELRRGMAHLDELFGSRFVPALVPPWNRIDPALLPLLPGLGFRGISASYKRHRPAAPAGLRRADAHCDLLDWKNGPAQFSGREKCVTNVVEHLKEKRFGRVDPDEPTGILTHHLEMDEDAWHFMDDLLSVTASHPAAGWTSPAGIWPSTE